jgi:DNA-binding response OmpR family regulator
MTSHILMIEDKAKLAQFIKIELEFENYQVTPCTRIYLNEHLIAPASV